MIGVGTKLWDRRDNIEHEVRGIVDDRLVLRYDSPKHPGRWAYEIITPHAVELGLYSLVPTRTTEMPTNNDWIEVTLRLRYRPSALTPGGEIRCEPSNVDELVEEIDRSVNASTFGGQIDLSIKNADADLLDWVRSRAAASGDNGCDECEDTGCVPDSPLCLYMAITGKLNELGL